jgi:hypothetical protein
MFTCGYDAEQACTLVSSGFVVCALRPNQIFAEGNIPFAVPGYVWKILLKNKHLFPYTPTDDGTHPWRESWMA